MSDNLKSKIERLEKAVGISEGADPRASRYPNNFVEMMLMAHVGEEKWRQFLRTRQSKPSPLFWDWLDQQTGQRKATKNNGLAKI